MDSITWAFQTFKDERGKKPYLMAWIHSHVRGAECCFSSIDNHTQYAYSKVHNGVLGLVIEIKPNGKKGVHEFYEMSRMGNQTLGLCSEQKNCITSEQHDSCNGRDLYQSASSKVLLDDFYSLTITNFMATAIEKAPHINDWNTENFQPPVHNDEEMAPEENFEETDQQEEENLTTCKYCGEKCQFILMHLRWHKGCKKKYGKEIDEIRKKINQDKKTKKRKYNKEKYDENPEKVKKRRNENIEAYRQSQRDYRTKNSEKLKQDHRRYNRRKAPIIAEKQQVRRKEARDNRTQANRFHYFCQATIDGPTFVCFSCKRALFKKGVKVMKDIEISKLFEKIGFDFLRQIGLDSHDTTTSLILCHNCLKKIKKKKVPNIHFSNGLELDDVPDELKIADLEQQLIARTLIFLKVKKLPRG